MRYCRKTDIRIMTPSFPAVAQILKLDFTRVLQFQLFIFNRVFGFHLEDCCAVLFSPCLLLYRKSFSHAVTRTPMCILD